MNFSLNLEKKLEIENKSNQAKLKVDTFLKMGLSRPLFVYFRHFLITILIIEKSIDGVLGIQTRGRRMVGADETTELWRPLLPRFKELPIHVRKSFFKKMGQSRPLFVYFRYFLITISIIQIEKA